MNSIITLINKRLPAELKREILSFYKEDKVLSIMKKELENWTRKKYFHLYYFNQKHLKELKEKRQYQMERDNYYFQSLINDKKWTTERIVKHKYDKAMCKQRLNNKLKELNISIIFMYGQDITLTSSDVKNARGNYHTCKINGVEIIY